MAFLIFFLSFLQCYFSCFKTKKIIFKLQLFFFFFFFSSFVVYLMPIHLILVCTKNNQSTCSYKQAYSYGRVGLESLSSPCQAAEDSSDTWTLEQWCLGCVTYCGSVGQSQREAKRMHFFCGLLALQRVFRTKCGVVNIFAFTRIYPPRRVFC